MLIHIFPIQFYALFALFPSVIVNESSSPSFEYKFDYVNDSDMIEPDEAMFSVYEN